MDCGESGGLKDQHCPIRIPEKVGVEVNGNDVARSCQPLGALHSRVLPADGSDNCSLFGPCPLRIGHQVYWVCQYRGGNTLIQGGEERLRIETSKAGPLYLHNN